MNLGLNKLWETTVYYTHFKDKNFRDVFTQDILENIEIYKKNSIEFQDCSIFNLNRSIIQQFKNEVVLPVLNEYLNSIDINLDSYDIGVKGWLTGQSSNYSLNYHNHKNSSVSAVFYPFVGENSNCFGGQIVFHDPRINANRGYVNEFSKLFESKIFLPKTGDIIIFPSFLYHHVNTYLSKMRIGIAVDYYTYNKKR